MKHRIFTLTTHARKVGMDWDAAIYYGEIETVAEFGTYQEAVAAFEDGGFDPDLYGVE